MDKLLDDLGLQGLFRNLLPGVFFVITWLYLKHGITSNFVAAIENHPWFYSAMAGIAGNICYICHRGSSNVVIDWIRSIWLKYCNKNKTSPKEIDVKGIYKHSSLLFPKYSLQMTVARWKIEGRESGAKHLKRWADFIHHLYIAALCVMLALFLAPAATCISRKRDCIIVAFTFLLIGFIGDYRRHLIELVLQNHPDHKIEKWPAPNSAK